MARVIPECIGGAGALMITHVKKDQELLRPLGPVGSSFDAEVAAEITAFETLRREERGSTVIWATDSRSLLDALNENVAKPPVTLNDSGKSSERVCMRVSGLKLYGC